LSPASSTVARTVIGAPTTGLSGTPDASTPLIRTLGHDEFRPLPVLGQLRAPAKSPASDHGRARAAGSTSPGRTR